LLLAQLSEISASPLVSVAYSLTSIASFKYFGWFSAGAAYYLYVKTNQYQWLYIAMAVSLICSIAESGLNLAPFAAAILISLVFGVSVVSNGFQKFLSNRFLLFMGFISYPFYLVHENMMISMIIKQGSYATFLPSFLFPFTSLIVVSLVAYIIVKRIEIPVKTGINGLISYATTLFRLYLGSRVRGVGDCKQDGKLGV